MDQCLNQLQLSGEIVTIQWEKQSVQLTGTDLQHLVLTNSPTNPSYTSTVTNKKRKIVFRTQTRMACMGN